jgi:hypothetical protein
VSFSWACPFSSELGQGSVMPRLDWQPSFPTPLKPGLRVYADSFARLQSTDPGVSQDKTFSLPFFISSNVPNFSLSSGYGRVSDSVSPLPICATRACSQIRTSVLYSDSNRPGQSRFRERRRSHASVDCGYLYAMGSDHRDVGFSNQDSRRRYLFVRLKNQDV